MEKLMKAPVLYIATQKVIIFVHQNSGWFCKPQDRSVFKKLFDISLNNLNNSVEKMIEVFGTKCMNLELQNNFFNDVRLSYNKFNDSPLLMSINIERDFLKLSERLYGYFKDNDVMSSGLYEFMMSNSSDHEELIVLLNTLSQDFI